MPGIGKLSKSAGRSLKLPLACFGAMWLMACGCAAKSTYREGDMLSLGAYVPWESSLYGVEIFQKMNGISVSMKTNQAFTVQREYSCTNSYFGIIHVNEHSKTKVEAK